MKDPSLDEEGSGLKQVRKWYDQSWTVRDKTLLITLHTQCIADVLPCGFSCNFAYCYDTVLNY